MNERLVPVRRSVRLVTEFENARVICGVDMTDLLSTSGLTKETIAKIYHLNTRRTISLASFTKLVDSLHVDHAARMRLFLLAVIGPRYDQAIDYRNNK